MKLSRLISFLLTVSVISFFLSNCSKDKDSEIVWKTGTVETYTIDAAPGETLTDTANDLTFSFPAGGTGTLEVAPVTSGAETPFGSPSFYINYDGNSEIRLIIPEDTTKVIALWGWGTNDGLMQDYTDYEEMWVSVPYEEVTGNNRSYILVMPTAGSLKNTYVKHQGFNYYNFSDESSPYYVDKKSTLTLEMIQMQNAYLAALPGVLKDSASARMARMPSKLVMGNSPSYDPWWNVLGKKYYKNIVNQNKDVEDAASARASLAHEDGHYMMHMLVGDDVYNTLYTQLPYIVPDNHGPGDERDRSSYYVEESAYFAEYFFTGKVSNSNSPENMRYYIWTENNMPHKMDYPSIEGFAAGLLANLHRSDNQVTDVYLPRNYVQKIDAPVIGASFTDIFGIIGKGSTNVDALSQHVAEYLIQAGKGDLIAPFFQRIGWGYQLRVKVLDPLGNPKKGVIGRSTCQGGGTTWFGEVSENSSGNDGIVLIPGAFGGNEPQYQTTKALIFYDEVDTFNINYHVIGLTLPWTMKTNEIVDIGTLTLQTKRPVVETRAATSITGNAAVLNASINPSGSATTGYFEYGLSPSYGSTASLNQSTLNGSEPVDVYASIGGLEPNKTYHFRIVAQNAFGLSEGLDETFITNESGNAPVAVTLAATNVGPCSATLNGTINPGGASAWAEFEYGLTTSYGNWATLNIEYTGDQPITVNLTLSKNYLTPNQTYHYRFNAYRLGFTDVSYGADMTFTLTGAIEVGQLYEGGIVFYVDETCLHGLIAPPEDLGLTDWGCSGQYIGALDERSGSANTAAIVAGCTTENIAAALCNDIALGGYTDWYLPSISELSVLIFNKDIVGGFSSGQIYWSSTEIDASNAYGVSVDDPMNWGPLFKNTMRAVRPIRAF